MIDVSSYEGYNRMHERVAIYSCERISYLCSAGPNSNTAAPVPEVIMRTTC